MWANVFAILLLIPIVLFFGLPYYFIWTPKLDVWSFVKSVGVQEFILTGFSFLGVLIIGIVFHELIHGIVWARYAKNGFKSNKFGILWKMMTPYCHCKESL